MTLEPLSTRLGLSPGQSRAGLVRMILRSLPTMVGVSLVTLALEHTGWFKGFETYALDSLFRISSSDVSDDLVIVTIDDQDYHKDFGGSSPINADALQRLLDAIEKGQPRVIGVDLDTSDKSFACVKSPHAVWAMMRPVCPQSQDPLEQGDPCESEDIVRLSARGGNLNDFPVPKQHGTHIHTDPSSGIVVFPQDDDGVVRRYRRTFHSSEAEPPSKLHGALDSLPWAVVKCYRASLQHKFPAADAKDDEPCPPEKNATEKTVNTGAEHRKIDPHDSLYADDEEELRLNFAGDHYRFDRVPARAVFQGAEHDYWKDNSPFKGAIVLVGGTYREARDAYVTPVGSRYGVELIAQAIESDLKNGGIRELNWIWALILDFVASIVLIFLNWRFPGPKLIYLNLVAIIVLSVGASLLAFGSAAYWFNFTSVLLGIWIHMIWDHAREHQAMKRELEAYRRGEHPPEAAH